MAKIRTVAGSTGKEVFEMNVHKISPEDTDISVKDALPLLPGSWLQRKLYNSWYLTYGFMLMTAKQKISKEAFTRYSSYDPEDDGIRPGAVVVITGGPRGIGYELCRRFLLLDCTVIMGCRNMSTSKKNIRQMREDGVNPGKVHLLPLNLKSLRSTMKFALGVLKLTDKVDLLMNNAEIVMTPYELTEDGFEAQFQVNYLSHFLLTLLLLPTMKRTAKRLGRHAKCRIINTCSAYHLAGSLDIEDLERKSVYSPPKAYFDSKLCQVLFTKQLEGILQKAKVNVRVFAVHPGITTANWTHKMVRQVMKPILRTPEEGAAALLHAALSKELENEGGSYLEGMHIAKPHSQTNDEDLQESLWRRSEILLQDFV